MIPRLSYRTTALSGVDGAGRTVHGIAVPYGQWTRIDGEGDPFEESFAPGAFTRSIRERAGKVKLLVQHDRGRLPIGRAVELREEPDGLHAAFVVAATREGDDALELVRTGTVDAFSVGFRPLRDVREPRARAGELPRRTVTEAALHEVSLVAFPAYEGAVVHGVRAAGDPVARVVVARRRLELTLAAWPQTGDRR